MTMLDPDHPVLIDFEAQSRADLPVVGGRNYWRHASSHALCCSWYDTRDGTSATWLPGQQWPHYGRTLAAHNAVGFDRFAAEKLGWSPPDDLYSWVDTSELARKNGLPGKLEALGERLGYPKDTAASKFTKSLSSVRRPGKKHPDYIEPKVWALMSGELQRECGYQKDVTPEDMARVVPYCENDVAIMREGWPLLSGMHGIEPEVERADRAINERGVMFDAELARALLRCDQINGDIVCRQVANDLGGGWTPGQIRAAANSPEQFTAQTGLPDATAETVDLVLAKEGVGYSALAYGLCRARRAIASIARGKLRAGLAQVSPDGRLRDNLHYYGAHTGRWSGKGMQLQNMPRPDKSFEELFGKLFGKHPTDEQIDGWICNLADAVKVGKHHATQAEVDLLLRACICAPPGMCLVAQDYKGVEARANAWAAGDENALAIFRAGDRDLYKVMATHIFQLPYDAIEKWMRQIGKNAELGCGYQMSGGRFNEYCLANGTDLSRYKDAQGNPLSPDAIVKSWRAMHAPIVKFWYALQRAFVRAAQGHSARVSCFDFEPSSNGRDVAIFLPSGRPIIYNDVECHEGDRPGSWSLSYMSARYGRAHIYGGKICENVIQGGCRDPLAQSMVAADRDGLRPVLTVHDELVAEVPYCARVEAKELLRATMIEQAEQLYPGFPADTDGFTGIVYRK